MGWPTILVMALLVAALVALALRIRSMQKKIHSLEHTAALIESAPYFIAYDNTESRDLYANPAACRMAGRPVGQPMTKESTHDEAGMRLLQQQAFPAVEKKGTWVGENRLMHSDGHMIDVQQFIFPVRDKAGKQIGMGTLMRDITEEKKMRRELDIQCALLDSCSNFIIALDRDQKVIYANPAVYKMSGYSREELGLRFTPDTFHDAKTTQVIREKLEEALISGQSDMESNFRRKDGSHIEVAHRMFAMRDKPGNTIGIGAILDDITELKDIQRDLLLAKEAAEAANRAKSQFLSNMSHEIRTPMNAIVGMTMIARESEDIARIRACLDKVTVSSEHLLNIINDILDLSKIESGKLELYREVFSVEAVVAKMASIINVKIEEKKQALSVRVAPDVPKYLFGDDNRLCQIIMNLLSNAAKFTDVGGKIELDVALESASAERVRLRLSVKDNGLGMTQEQQGRLFQSFEQADNSITKRFGGTGLGLAISQKLAHMMDGQITIASAPGEGSCFTLSAGFERVDESQIPAEAQDEAAAGEADYRGKRLLVVEDIEINREILRALLESTGLEIDEAEDGALALDMVLKSPEKYDLVFMDVQMPNMDGYAATRAIRQAGIAQLPIIAMTANAFSEDIRRAIDSGMNDHIAKPVDPGEMLRKMAQFL